LMRSAGAVLSLSIKAPQSAMILSAMPVAIAARQGAGSTAGALSAPVPAACAGASKLCGKSATTADTSRACNAKRISGTTHDALPRHGLHGKSASIIHVDLDARLQTQASALPFSWTFQIDHLRMDHRPAARGGRALGAGAAAWRALSDLSCRRRRTARLRAGLPVLDARSEPGARAVRCTRAARCGL